LFDFFRESFLTGEIEKRYGFIHVDKDNQHSNVRKKIPFTGINKASQPVVQNYNA